MAESAPNIHRFARDAEVWERHQATSNWTKPSHASMLTGHFTEVHGADKEGVIHPGVRTLAERFREHGFVTGACVFDTPWLAGDLGFARGFDEYALHRWGLRHATRAVSNWVEERRDQDFFFFFHTYEAHSDYHLLPYESPGATQETVASRFGALEYGYRGGHRGSKLLRAMNDGQVTPLPGEAEILRYLYDRSVAHLDEQLGVLFSNLRQMGVYDDLLIVLTSDHGESFFEHGKWLHYSAWEELLHVPLVIKWPGGEHARRRHSLRTSAVDLAPTLLAAFGLDRSGLPGPDLHQRQPGSPVFSFTQRGSVVYRGDLKAVVDPEKGEQHLYDLSADPSESRDLSREQPGQMERFAGWIARRREEDRRLREEAEELFGQAATTELTEDERARLRALGYL